MAFLEPTSTRSFDVRTRRDYWSGHQQTSEEGAVGVADHRGSMVRLACSKPSQRCVKGKPCLIHRLLGAEQDPIPTDCTLLCGQFGEPNQLLVEGNGTSDICGSGSCGSASIPTVSTPRL
jgi:hypothetical protein